MKIAVTAASGQFGRTLIRQLKVAEPEHELTGLARTPDKAADLGIEIRPGDYDHKAQLEKSLAGIDVCILISGMAPPDERIVQHTNVVQAAQTAGVRKILFTSIGSNASCGGFDPVVACMHDTEDVLRQSGMEWVVGRNGLYIEPDFDYRDTYAEAGAIENCAGDRLCSYTSRAELARAYAALIVDKRFNNKTFHLAGPGITQAELAEAMNQVFGTSLVYKPMSVDDYIASRVAEHGDFMGQIIAGIYVGIANGAFELESDFEEIVGRPHKTAVEMAQEYLAQLS
ncbi:MAG: NAD(P)H-binding protein [Gammaproteobacteria bacterium]|nr:NAD(P)H-binding protein [Gammaproteobacteria bacterium]